MNAQSIKVLQAVAPASLIEQLGEASIAVIECAPVEGGNALFYTDASLLENARVQGLSHPLLDEIQTLFDQNPGHAELWLLMN